MTSYDTFDSPLGSLTTATDGVSLTALHIQGDRHFDHIPADWKRDTHHPVMTQARQELEAYFAGKQKSFTVPVTFIGTPFQQAVWSVVQTIPYGATMTYSEIAKQTKRPLAVRAVGTAVGRNAVCIIVPCHRVIASDGSLGGYIAGEKRKQYLLDLEGGVNKGKKHDE